jgi:hypothetical protein
MLRMAMVVGMAGVVLLGCVAAPEKEDTQKIGEAPQDSLGGTLCAGVWGAVAGLGCLAVQSLCDGSDAVTITVDGTKIPCEDAVIAACVGVTALTAAGSHVCPK